MEDYLEVNWIKIMIGLSFSWIFILGVWFFNTTFFGILSMILLALLVYVVFDALINLSSEDDLGAHSSIVPFIGTIFGLLLNATVLYGLVAYG